jgi:hypothetical protein
MRALLTCAWSAVLGLAVISAPPPASGTVEAERQTSGVFVAYSAQAGGDTVTIQDGHRLVVYTVAPDVVVTERDGDGPAKPSSAAELAPGEPVTLHVGPEGIVEGIEAAYTTVLTRLVTYAHGAVVTTSGQVYTLVGAAAEFGGPFALGTFLKLRVDPVRSSAFDIAASEQPFSGGALAVPVPVTFIVTVPANTPPTDTVYLATDAGNWVANGTRMSPLAAHTWTATLMLPKGSSLKYKYTRGSWQTAETDRAGMQIPNRSLSVTATAASQTVRDTVVRWADLPS